MFLCLFFHAFCLLPIAVFPRLCRHTVKMLGWLQKNRMEMLAIEEHWQYQGGEVSAAQYTQMAS